MSKPALTDQEKEAFRSQIFDTSSEVSSLINRDSTGPDMVFHVGVIAHVLGVTAVAFAAASGKPRELFLDAVLEAARALIADVDAIKARDGARLQ
jgi:hypothetical protein